MLRRTLTLGVLAVSLAASSGHTQTAQGGASQSTASAVDPAAIQALKDMGAYLQTLNRFGVSTELTAERVLGDGQKLQHAAMADMDVHRPNKLRALMHSARSERELLYDGKTAVLYAPAQKYYSSVGVVDTLGGLVSRLRERYGVEVPLSDLFLWGTPAAPLDKIESAMNAGQDFIGDRPLRSLRLSARPDRLADLDRVRKQASAAQGRDHESGRRGASAVGLPSHLELKTEVHRRGVHVHAAEG